MFTTSFAIYAMIAAMFASVTSADEEFLL